MVILRNIRMTLSPTSEGENRKSTLTPCGAVDESDANQIDNLGWEIQILCPSSKHLDFVVQMLGTSCFLICNELGDCEDIARFVMPSGMFTPRISQTHCCAVFRNFVQILVSRHPSKC